MSAAVDIEAIAIGGSAGALDGLLALLKALPEGFRPSLLIVVHVPPDRPSLLAQVLGDQCRLPVREALDKEPIEPGVAYVAPPDYHLLVESSRQLALSRDEPVAFSRPSIDVMFESAAQAYGSRVLGIVLSGANADGAAGLAAIRKARGRAWVQDPREAQVPTMPAAAIEQAGADLVLGIHDMAQRLAHLRSGRALLL
jgi:two-component system, chemotaxis family, protein-glutamate methylesterase/glutaminase